MNSLVSPRLAGFPRGVTTSKKFEPQITACYNLTAMTNLDYVHGASTPREHRLEHGLITRMSGSNPSFRFRSPVACPLSHRRHVTFSWFPPYIPYPDSGSVSFMREASVGCHHGVVTYRHHEFTFEIGHHRFDSHNFQMAANTDFCNLKMAASLRHLLRSTLALSPEDMFDETLETNSRRIFLLLQGWLPQVMS